MGQNFSAQKDLQELLTGVIIFGEYLFFTNRLLISPHMIGCFAVTILATKFALIYKRDIVLKERNDVLRFFNRTLRAVGYIGALVDIRHHWDYTVFNKNSVLEVVKKIHDYVDKITSLPKTPFWGGDLNVCFRTPTMEMHSMKEFKGPRHLWVVDDSKTNVFNSAITQLPQKLVDLNGILDYFPDKVINQDKLLDMIILVPCGIAILVDLYNLSYKSYSDKYGGNGPDSDGDRVTKPRRIRRPKSNRDRETRSSQERQEQDMVGGRRGLVNGSDTINFGSEAMDSF